MTRKAWTPSARTPPLLSRSETQRSNALASRASSRPLRRHTARCTLRTGTTDRRHIRYRHRTGSASWSWCPSLRCCGRRIRRGALRTPSRRRELELDGIERSVSWRCSWDVRLFVEGQVLSKVEGDDGRVVGGRMFHVPLRDLCPQGLEFCARAL